MDAYFKICFLNDVFHTKKVLKINTWNSFEFRYLTLGTQILHY